MKTRMAGFTLIEILIAVIIVGILASIAIPSYMRYAVGAARRQAESTMLNLAQMEERYYTNNYAYYAVSAVPPAVDLYGWSNFSGGGMATRKYDIAVAVSSVPVVSYMISASPSNNFVDAQCKSLTLDFMGNKTSETGDPTCW